MTVPGQTWEEFGIPRTKDERLKGFGWVEPKEGSLRSRLVPETLKVVADYNAQGIQPPVRSVAYRVCANLGLPHTSVDYAEDVVGALRRGRKLGMRTVSNLRTESHVPWTKGTAASAARAARASLTTITRDRMKGQPYRAAVVAEASGMLPFFTGICWELGVPLYSGSGSVPTETVYDIASDAVSCLHRTQQPTVVFVITDYDLMGIRNIYVPFAQDVEAFAADLGLGSAVIVRRIAATPDQVRENVPENLRQPAPSVDWWDSDFSLPTAEALLDVLPGILRTALTDVMPDDEARAKVRSHERKLGRKALKLLRKDLRDD